MGNELSERLIVGLAEPDALDQRCLRSAAGKIAPKLAYGRHFGPAPRDARRAAVAIVWLQKRDGSWIVPLTLRPVTLRHHGGQICFPGGMIEADETPVQAALREFEEELGQRPVSPLFCGSMQPLYVYASHNLIYPVVFTAAMPGEGWTPDPAEVDRVIELPLATVQQLGGAGNDPRRRQIVRDRQVVGEYRFDSIAYRVGEDRIWGATAILIQQLGWMVRGQGQATEATELRNVRRVAG